MEAHISTHQFNQLVDAINKIGDTILELNKTVELVEVHLHAANRRDMIYK